jgi:hypothetical protein
VAEDPAQQSHLRFRPSIRLFHILSSCSIEAWSIA